MFQMLTSARPVPRLRGIKVRQDQHFHGNCLLIGGRVQLRGFKGLSSPTHAGAQALAIQPDGHDQQVRGYSNLVKHSETGPLPSLSTGFLLCRRHHSKDRGQQCTKDNMKGKGAGGVAHEGFVICSGPSQLGCEYCYRCARL
jgi:hypothetical protein